MKIFSKIFIITSAIYVSIFFASRLIENQKELTLITLFFILFLQIYKFKINLNFKNLKFSKIIIYLTFLLIILIFQNKFLNYETITWDVSSYLVATNDISLGNLPFTNQWESKGPLLIYFYKFISYLSFGSYTTFKIFNDILLWIISIILFNIIYQKSENIYTSTISVLFFEILFSIEWFVSEFSELYCLFFLAFAQFVFVTKNNTKLNNFIIGFLLSLSTLINQGSVIFIIPYLIIFYLNNREFNKRYLGPFFLGLFVPHVFFICLYYFNSLIEIYFINYFIIPLKYTGESLSSFYEIRVFLREIYNINFFIYFCLIGLIYLFLKENIIYFIKKPIKLISDIDYLNLITALFYYFIAGHNFYHHFIYFIFFTTFLIVKIIKTQNILFIYSSVLLSFIFVLFSYSLISINNLRNIAQIESNYPLKQLATEIDNYFNEDEYTVLALDYVLVLYYLDKPNYSYIVHPTNHYQEYITETLINFNKIEQNHIVKLINSKPDVLICNLRGIDSGGKVISYDPSNFGSEIDENSSNICELDKIFKGDYIKIGTENFKNNESLSFYKDPYKEMNVYIKKER